MGHDNKNTPSLPIDQPDAPTLAPARVAPGGASMTSIAADRLYQLAAVTAGIFLLATLL
jgi:hypothetical protein